MLTAPASRQDNKITKRLELEVAVLQAIWCLCRPPPSVPPYTKMSLQAVSQSDGLSAILARVNSTIGPIITHGCISGRRMEPDKGGNRCSRAPADAVVEVPCSSKGWRGRLKARGAEGKTIIPPIRKLRNHVDRHHWVDFTGLHAKDSGRLRNALDWMGLLARMQAPARTDAGVHVETSTTAYSCPYFLSSRTARTQIDCVPTQ